MIALSLLLAAAAVLAPIPAGLWVAGGNVDRPGPILWLLILVAVAGPAAWVATRIVLDGTTQFGVAIGLSATVTAALHAAVAAATRQGWRLTPIVMAYVVTALLIALVTSGYPAAPESGGAIETAWVWGHIVFAVAAYSLLTLAALAGVGVLFRERAIKRKHPTDWSAMLPSVADGDRLQVGLMVLCAAVLALGVATGVASRYVAGTPLFEIDHKSLLSLVALVVVLALALAHRLTGVRGREVARWILGAYLLLTLAYPGVKFVTDVLMA